MRKASLIELDTLCKTTLCCWGSFSSCQVLYFTSVAHCWWYGGLLAPTLTLVLTSSKIAKQPNLRSSLVEKRITNVNLSLHFSHHATSVLLSNP
jgi:hypothetical protein